LVIKEKTPYVGRAKVNHNSKPKFFDFINKTGIPSEIIEIVDSDRMKEFVVATQENDCSLLIEKVGTKENEYEEALQYVQREKFLRGR
jgi:hypothetical protein